MPKYAKDERGVSMMGKASEIWKEIKPKIGEMLVAVNDIETRAEKAQEEAYQKGLSDAWDAARKISHCALWDDYRTDTGKLSVYTGDVLDYYTASEAIEKLKAYEQEKDAEIKVGDEVVAASGKAVVLRVLDVNAYYVYKDATWGFMRCDELVKTGRTFPEIATVLEKMREE